MDTIDLKRLRKDFNLTQKELAEVLEVQQPFLSRIENGLDTIPRAFFDKLKQNFGLSDLSNYEITVLPSSYRRLRGDLSMENQSVPIYEMEATAGIASIFTSNSTVRPADYLMIPNLTKADGALFARGDSMYPLIKNGDLVVYKMVNLLPDLLIWGEMYILYFDFDGEEMLTIKYVQQGSTPDKILLVSQNQHHAPKEFSLLNLKAAALVKAVINYRSMI
ncbi:MAG: helix-turn-helix transcriptional regulator [Mangrovibacterium sp.]